MPATVQHVLTATTPDDPTYEIRPSHWNSAHALTLSLAGSEVSPVFSNANGLSFGLSGTAVTGSYTVPDTAAFLTTAMASNASSVFAGIGETVTTVAGTNLGLTVDTSGVQIAHPVWLTTAQPVGAYLTTARASNDAIGLNTAATQVTWTVNSGGISLNAGAYLTTAMASNRGTDFVQATAAFAGTNASGTIASNGISVSVAAPGAGGGIAAAAGTQTATSGTVLFNNANGITFGMSNSSVITASHNGLTTARASNDAVGLNTALTANGVAWTVNSGGISLNVPAFLTTARASNDAVGLNTAQTNVTWTVNSGGISVNAAGYAGTGTSATNATVTLNSNGLAISVAAPGGGAANTVSYYANARQFVNSQTMTFLQSTSHVLPFVVDQYVSFAFMRIAASGSVLAASSTAATTGNTSYSAGHFRSHNLVIYSRGAGANSMSLQYVTSTQFAEAFRMTQSHAANSTQHSYTLNYTFPCSSGDSGVTKNYSSSAASLNYHTSHLTDLTGLKVLEIPFAGSLSPGRYWLAYGISSTTSTARTADQSRQGIAFTALGMSQATLAFGYLGSATNSSVMPFEANGSFTTVGGGTTSSIPMSAVRSSASHNQLFFQLMRVT